MLDLEKVKNTILLGDALENTKKIPSESIDAETFSPPYWGLRDYSRCECVNIPRSLVGSKRIIESPERKDSREPDPNCSKCKGTGHDIEMQKFQWGLEPTFADWINKMLLLTNELKRVLKKTGSLWLNIGDVYFGSRGNNPQTVSNDNQRDIPTKSIRDGSYYMQKCLCFIPERLVMRMIDEQGWILRNKIIWFKPNSMPASVTDRLKNSWEYVYHFVKVNEPIWWHNVITGERVETQPEQKYIWNSIIVDKWEAYCFVCSTRFTDRDEYKEHSEDHDDHYMKVSEPLWKSHSYYYDLDAIRVPAKTGTLERYERNLSPNEQLKLYEKSNNPIQNIKAKKQDNVPSKNASLYTGFNKRWKKNREEAAKAKDGPWDTVVNNQSGGNTGLEKFRRKQEFLKDNKYRKDDPDNLARKQAWLDTVESGSNIMGANPGDVWTISTQPYKGAHFATFPERLIEPMIKATCPKQICSKCKFIRTRITKPNEEYAALRGKGSKYDLGAKTQHDKQLIGNTFSGGYDGSYQAKTIGWTSCSCSGDDRWKAGIVYDPFMGSGTVAVVAQKLGVNWLGSELNEKYVKLAYNRIFKGSKSLEDWV